MTRKRINVAFLERGFIDPILASTCTQIQQIKDQYEISYEDIFDIFCSDKDTHPPSINKGDFVEAVQSMGIKSAVEDINELFNYIDMELTNRITKTMFVHSISFITSKIGAGSMEQHMNKGII
jgi:Ca2+-binding EF-hand superfamily protein